MLGYQQCHYEYKFQTEPIDYTTSKASGEAQVQGHLKRHACYLRNDVISTYYERQFKHMELQRTAHMACLKMNVSPGMDNALGYFHQAIGWKDGSLKRDQFLSLMVSLSEQFRHFSLQQTPFLDLTIKDQRLLLGRNTSR